MNGDRSHRIVDATSLEPVADRLTILVAALYNHGVTSTTRSKRFGWASTDSIERPSVPSSSVRPSVESRMDGM